MPNAEVIIEIMVTLARFIAHHLGLYKWATKKRATFFDHNFGVTCSIF